MAVSTAQPMREAEQELITQFNTLSGTGGVTTDMLADASVTQAKLDTALSQQARFLQTVPAIEFGTSNSISVSANSNTAVTITFGSTKTEVPLVFPAIQCASTTQLFAIVQSVTNAQASIIVFNNTSTDASNVTVDWLAISGR